MILTAASQSGIWGYTTTNYNSYLLPDPSVVSATQGNMGFWSTPTQAPNGLIYMLPVSYNSQDGGVTPSSWVAVGKPNTTTKKTDWYIIRENGTTRSVIPNAGNTNTSVRYGARGILAPNGLLYFLPKRSGTTDTGILIMNPGSGLETSGGVATISGTTLTITSVTSGVFGINQTITYIDPISSNTVTRTITNFGTGTGGTGTYTLNSAVPNPVAAVTITGSEFPNCTWEIKTYASIRAETGNANFVNTQFASAILGKDGYIYLLPTGQILARIAPRNTAVNPTSSDIYEVHGYYDGSTTARRFYSAGNNSSIYLTPRDINGTALSKVAPYPTVNIAPGTYYAGIECGILHPNGKIYMAGLSRWIFILDPSRWSLADASVVYSENSLALRTDICLITISTKDLLLEKPISNTLVKIKEIPSYLGGTTVTVKITDTNQVYDGMTATVYSGTGVFAAGTVTVLNKNAATSEITLQNTSVTDILTTNFDSNDLVMLTPTQQMIENVNIFWIPDLNSVGNSTANPQRRLYKIDPNTNVLTLFGDAMGTGLPGSGQAFNSINALFPNGFIYKPAVVVNTNQNSTTYIISGSDALPFKSFQ